jgi:hypothetical protein
MTKLTPTQQGWLDQDNTQMKFNGLAFSQLWNAACDQVNQGNVGIISPAINVDAVCISGGHFELDLDTAPGTSLLFAWKASRFVNAGSELAVSAGTLTLSASNTNYIEVDGTGTVSANTTAFTSGRCPIMTIVAGVGSWTPNNRVIHLPFISIVLPNSITGTLLSAAGRTKEEHIALGGISTTISRRIIAPGYAGTLAAGVFVGDVAVAASDTDYFSWSITNLGSGGLGATAMLDTGAVNTTKLTGGSALVASARRVLTLNGTPANLAYNAHDVLLATITKTGAPASQNDASLRLDFAVTI